MKIFQKLIPLVTVLILSFWAVKPLLNPGFFPMHDDTQVARVFEMHKSLADGMFPVRWVTDLGYGYGYPIFNFYAPLAYYIGALFMFLGFNALIATKIMIGLGTVLAGVFMYLFAKEFWGKIGGIVSAVLYLYAPYHALNIYVRGAVAELWAYAFIPLAFLGVYKVYCHCEESASRRTTKQSHKDRHAALAMTRNLWLWVCVSAVAYAGIIISHNLTAMMVTPFLFVFALFLYFKLRYSQRIYRPYFVLLGILLGIMLSAFYWLPALLEMKFTDVLSVVGGGSNYKDHFVCLSQLWNSSWGFGGSVPGCVDGLSFKIGKLHILMGAISFLAFIPLLKKDKTKFQLSLTFLIFLIISIFFTLKESKFVWDVIPHMAFFQFPWRFLALVSFFISFLGGAILMCLPSTNLVWVWIKRGVGAIIIFAIIFVNADVFVPQKIINAKSDDYTNKTILNWKVSKISDEYMPKGFFKPLRPIDVPKNKFESGNKNFKILASSEKTQEIKAKIVTPSKTTVYVNIAYFPSWHVFIDNQQVWFKYSGQGLLIEVPSGKHSIDIKFTQTPIENIGNAISLTGVIILLAGIILTRPPRGSHGFH